MTDIVFETVSKINASLCMDVNNHMAVLNEQIYTKVFVTTKCMLCCCYSDYLYM